MYRLFLLLLFLPSFLQAQNLVPNPSFEDTVFCPMNFSGIFGEKIYALTNWFPAGRSPDFLHSCGVYNVNNAQADVPYNGVGYQFPRSGEGYIGLITFYNSTAISNYREFIGVQLNQVLNIGTKYYFRMYISSAYGQPGVQNIYSYSNNIGIKLSTQYFESQSNILLPDNFPTAFSSVILTDTTNWIPIDFEFVADSNFQYLYIGNFFDDMNTDTISVFGITSSTGSYQYIDDIVITTDSTLLSSKEIISNNEIKTFPNPFKYKFNFKLNTEPLWIKLFLADGKEIPFEMERKEDAYFIKPLSQNVPALIFVRILSKDGVYSSGKVLYQP
jgi:hypothetical protein